MAGLPLDLLRTIVSCPTAPYHEERVAARVIAYLHEWDIPFSVDETGNIIAHYQRGPEQRPLILMAHLDHPAFSMVERSGLHGADWTARLEGGVGTAYFEQPVAVRMYPRAWGLEGAAVTAQIVGYARDAEAGSTTLHVQLDDPAAPIAPGDFGVWDLPDYELRNEVVHARAIDDLAGCAAMLLVLRRAAQEGWETDLYAAFTRAEEVGLVGAYAVLQSGMLPRDGYLVSLEASPMLPGAVQGEGPVIRVGDRVTTFSQDAELALKAAAHRLGSSVWRPERGRPASNATVKVQRQLMSGGMCEASAAVMLSYQATGLALPLGNYHNQGPESTLAPETIHATDFLTGVALLQEAARLLPELERVRAEHHTAYGPRADQIERLRQGYALDPQQVTPGA
jgi:endoglucanase